MERRSVKKMGTKNVQPTRIAPSCMSEGPLKNTIKRSNKQNQQKVFFIENECQVLKLRSKDIEMSLKGLRNQLYELEDRKKLIQKECLSIQKQIQVLENGNIPELKSSLLKLQHTLSNKSNQAKSFQQKIIGLKRFIEQKTFHYQQQLKKANDIQVQKWRMHSQNQGIRIVQQNIQSQIQQLKEQKAYLLDSNIEYQPEQIKMNQHIQNTISSVNKQKQINKEQVSKYSGKCLFNTISRIHKQIILESLQVFLMNSQRLQLIKKKLLCAFSVSNKYISQTKHKYFERFKRTINPIQQEKRLFKSLQMLYNNKLKFRILSIMKKQFLKIQYAQLRKQQMMNAIVQILGGVQNSLKFSCFNIMKQWNNFITQSVCKVTNTFNKLKSKTIKFAFSLIYLKYEKSSYQLRQQDHYYNKVQKITINKYFKAWQQHHKSLRLLNLASKFKIFNILKQNMKQTKRNKYLQMVHLIIKKNNTNKLLIRAFYGLKIGTKQQIIDDRMNKGQKIEQLIEKQSALNVKQINRKRFKCREIGLQRIVYYFNNSIMRESFTIIQNWSSQSLKISNFQKILSRMIKINHLAKSFRLILIFSNLSNHLSIKQEIDNHSKQVKQQLAQIYCLKQQNIELNDTLKNKIKLVIIKWIQMIQTKIIRTSFRKIERYGIQNLRILKILRRIITTNNRLTIKQSFDNINQFSRNKQLKQLRQLGVKNMINKRVKIIMKQFIVQLKQTKHRNYKFRAIIVNIYKKLKNIMVGSVFDSLKNNIMIHKITDLKLNKNKLEKVIPQLEQQFKNKRDETNRDIYSSQIQISQYDSYKKRHSINVITKFAYRPGSIALNRWLYVLKKQNCIKAFSLKLTNIIQRSIIRKGFNIFVLNLQNLLTNQQITKHEKVVKQFQFNSQKALSYSQQLQSQINKLKSEYVLLSQKSEFYSKVLNNFENIKIEKFKKDWSSKFVKFIFLNWKSQFKQTKSILSKFANVLLNNQCQRPFNILSKNLRISKQQQIVNTNLTKCILSCNRISMKNLFVYWRESCFKLYKQQLQKQIQSKHYQIAKVDKRIQSRQQIYEKQIIQHFQTIFKKRVIQKMSSIHRENKNKRQLIQLTAKTCKGIISRRALKKILLNSQYFKQQHNFLSNIQKNKLDQLQKITFSSWKKYHNKLKKFEKLFLNKYINHQILTYSFDFIKNMKLISQRVGIKQMDKSNNIIIKLVYFYQNTLIMSLQKGFLKWRNNMDIIKNRKTFLKRFFKKVNLNKVYHSWNIWKLQAKARSIQNYHQSEGQIRVKHNQYKRTKKYLQQFKQSKGLVIYNGDELVSSPRYRQKQDNQQQNQNVKKYQLLSRLILLQSGQLQKIQLWNSLKFFQGITSTMRKKALFIHNTLRNFDKYSAFKKWKFQSKKQSNRLNNMNKNELAQQIQNMQQKLQVLHSSKQQLKEQTIYEIKRTQFTHRFLESKALFSKILVLRSFQNLKRHALSIWHSVAQKTKQQQQQRIQMMALRRIQQLTQQLQSLQYSLQSSLIVNQKLEVTALQGAEIAQTLKQLTNQRDELNDEIKQQYITCQALNNENQMLQNKFNMAQKEAYQLLELARD